MFTPHPEIQYASPEEIKAFQEERMREAMAYAAEHSKFYQRMFAQTGASPSGGVVAMASHRSAMRPVTVSGCGGGVEAHVPASMSKMGRAAKTLPTT